MNIKLLEPTIKQLVDRVTALEQALLKQESFQKESTRASQRLDQREEEYRRHTESNTRQILKKTFGMISPARGKELLKALEKSRQNWSRKLI